MSTLDLPIGVHGTADPEFHLVARAFARVFARRQRSGGALAIRLYGKPVVNLWAGAADTAGTPWTADTGCMVYSASKGVAATVIHRLADRGVLDYDQPVAQYWPEFAAAGKDGITVRQLLSHRAGLSGLASLTTDHREVLDHELMERRLAASAPDRLLGLPIYHALTFGWLLAGLGRAVTGFDMAELFRREVADPLGVDGIHLGRPQPGSVTTAANIVGSRLSIIGNPIAKPVVTRVAALPGPTKAAIGTLYLPGLETMLEGDDPPVMSTQMPAGNAVCTATGLAAMYSALACDGMADGRQYLSSQTVQSISKVETFKLDRALGPMYWHLGYHSFPAPGAPRGFGHLGAGGSGGWADPASGLSIGFVHNRLDAKWLSFDMTLLAVLCSLALRGVRASQRAEEGGQRRAA